MNELKQINDLTNYMLDNIEPKFEGALYDYIAGLTEYLYEGEIPDEDVMINIVLTGSHFGSLIRETYYNAVWKGPYKNECFWNALIFTFVMTRFWKAYSIYVNMEDLFKTELYQNIIEYMSYPEWIKVGICGESWSKIRKMCKSYCQMIEFSEGDTVLVKRGKDKGKQAAIISKGKSKVEIKVEGRTKKLSYSSIKGVEDEKN